MSEVLKLLKPVALSQDVWPCPEPATSSVTDTPDPALWDSSVGYVQGNRVYSNITDTIYEATSLSGNAGKNPDVAANSSFWIKVGPVNRLRMFDTSSSTQTRVIGTMQFTVSTAGTMFNGIALVNVTGADSVRIVQTDPTAGVVFDKTTPLRAAPRSADAYAYCFDPIEKKSYYFETPLPAYPKSSVQVTLTAANGTDVIGVGSVLLGPVYDIGNGVQYGARIGITDYSKKKTDAYGETQFTPGAFSAKASFQMWVNKPDVEGVRKLLASARATPCLWQGTEYYGSATMVFGAYKDWEFTIQYFDQSMLNLELEGLTEK